ncbi:MAG: PAS-domain containing protein, partial [Pseudomonadota bacterium]
MGRLGRLADEGMDVDVLRENFRILREAIRHSPIHFGIYDAQGHLIHWNESFAEAFPKTFAERAEDAEAGRITYRDLMREAAGSVVPPEELEAEVERRIEAGKTLTRSAHMIVHPQKGHMRILRYRMPGGEVGAIGVDMNEMVAASEALDEAREAAEAHRRRMQEAMDALPFVMGLHDNEGRIVMINRLFRERAPVSEEVIEPGRPYEDMIRALAEQGFYGTEQSAEEIVAERMDKLFTAGPPYESETSSGVFAAYDTRTEGGDIISCRVDITELKRVQKRLEEQAKALAEAKEASERQAMHDALTGLPNRRHLDIALARVAEEAAATEEQVALLHVDLDRFKQIND